MSSALSLLVDEFFSAGSIIADLDGPAQAELRQQGRAMRDAMLTDLRELPGLALACVVGPDEADAAAVPGVRAVPLAAGLPTVQAHARCLRAWAEAGGQVWVVAPECAGVLAMLADAVAPAAWIGCSAAAIRVAGSKRATTE